VGVFGKPKPLVHRFSFIVCYQKFQHFLADPAPPVSFVDEYVHIIGKARLIGYRTAKKPICSPFMYALTTTAEFSAAFLRSSRRSRGPVCAGQHRGQLIEIHVFDTVIQS
jgi:hypothetical protein